MMSSKLIFWYFYPIHLQLKKKFNFDYKWKNLIFAHLFILLSMFLSRPSSSRSHHKRLLSCRIVTSWPDTYSSCYRMSLLHIRTSRCNTYSIISRCVTRCRKIFVCAWIVLLICLKTPETAKKKVFRPMGGGLFTCKAQWKMDIKTKTLLFLLLSEAN